MKVALAVAISAAAVVTGSAQQPTFSSRVDAVRVDVLVKDRGQIVRGLGPRDFEVRDEGVLQEVDLVRLEQVPLNVILGFDVPGGASRRTSTSRSLNSGTADVSRNGTVASPTTAATPTTISAALGRAMKLRRTAP